MIPTPTPALHALPRTRGYALAWALLGMLAGLSTWSAEAAPFAYVTSPNAHKVSVIDTASNSVMQTIEVGSAPLGGALAPDGNRAYVVDSVLNNVLVIDTANNTVLATVQVGPGPEGIAITPDGKFAYVTNSSYNTV